MSGAVSVVVADRHPIFRDALARELALAGLDVRGSATDGPGAHALIAATVPDVAVLDVDLPGLTGPQVCSRLEREGAPTRVLVLSEHVGSAVYGALEAGAAGCVSKCSTAGELRDAVLAVARGEYVLADDAGSALVEELHARGGSPLSDRETGVLTLIADGHSSREIAALLHLAVPTVKTHTSSMFRKLGVSDRGAAVAEAMRRGLLD